MVAHVINLSHTLTAEHMAQISELLASRADIDSMTLSVIPVHINMGGDILLELNALYERVDAELEKNADIFVIALPGLALAAAFIAATIAQLTIAQLSPPPVYATVMRRREGSIVNIYDVVDLWRIV